jgi:hypothetical protein
MKITNTAKLFNSKVSIFVDYTNGFYNTHNKNFTGLLRDRRTPKNV